MSRSFFRRLKADTSGLALIEFAYSLPIMLFLALGGIELANYAVTQTRISQMTITVADNASRAKQVVVNANPRFREYDVQEVFRAAEIQAGNLDIRGRGRIIMSSIERNAQGGQWIHWQRCFGRGNFRSSYGVQGAGRTGTSITAIGPAGRQIVADAGSAIIFVEIFYPYEALSMPDIIRAPTIRKTAAMYVRDDRDLSQIYNPSPAVAVASC
ncbi:hypothetical protein GRI97_13270 [Altererythrobacter xixiisoli]|uniref:TadE-like domain-containing protein n=1 Tax=Croceibacterium xixiisoli TaxID=1476466 RepID=A0A6I4TZB6_9SPHN|nr:TadE/TadG family type IV pilus assembly protein [Croceibacterium xixiisoli]MXO99958.1 hypothetical protein [Croceibacterium xixiisoli]